MASAPMLVELASQIMKPIIPKGYTLESSAAMASGNSETSIL